MPKKATDIIKLLIFMGVAVLLVYLSISKLTEEQRTQAIDSMKNAHFFWLGLSIILGAISHLSRSMRWKIALEPMGYNPGLANSFFAVMIGYFSNMGIPRSGEVARCSILYSYEGVPVQRSFGTVVTERIIDLIMLMIFFFLTVLVEFDTAIGYFNKHVFNPAGDMVDKVSSNGYLPVLGGLILLTLVFFYVMARKYLHKLQVFHKFRQILKGFMEGIITVKKLNRPGMYIFHTVLIWILYYLMAFVCFQSMPATEHLGIGPGLVVFAVGSVAMIFSPGGIGAYPILVGGALLLYGVSEAEGQAFGWLVWSAQSIMIVMLGLLSLIVLPLINKNKPAPAKDGSPETPAA